MHRDEVIYARSDARGGITLTVEEAALAAAALRRYHPYPWRSYDPETQALASRLEAASTTPSP